MKVISDKAVTQFLNKSLTKSTLLNEFVPTLFNGLKTYSQDPDHIVPPRIAQQSNNTESDTTHVYMPCISPEEVGIKVISGGQGNNSKGLGFVGCVLVMDEVTGELRAVLNANTLTAFRTALASILGLVKIISVDEQSEILPELTVFGVGLQAYWHVKLALSLYGDKIKVVNILNRSLENAVKLKEKFEKEVDNVVFNAFLYQSSKQDDFVNHIRNSSIIFGCTPATSPIIKTSYINQDPQWPVFISLIGSYKPHMIELDLGLVKLFKDKGVKIIVDSKEHTLHEAGELIQANYVPDDLVEIHELYNEHIPKVTETTSNITVQKIVGLSIMDLAMAKLVCNKISDENVVVVQDF
ncbi:conserved hypothetical protein [Lodderomyces elongisporus NRRL YB-4239]|uniref:Ornithine cyclodeaminase n=1 Tax=Lodderomyces elongisporus (strain ATCC 11503 / CBS 2605 / JCM 1781 / NBRC 1676 / NRRL YB-4239) TaxID=379508 RepID=A5DSJ8_LODEL|nr:conserved hypothetical protein [Lodderomyces elongisporus NRRL YB-4239]